MKTLLALFIARNKEYYRDKSSLAWSFVMPLLIIGVIALTFSEGGRPVFKVGILGEATTVSSFPSITDKLSSHYIQAVNYDSQHEALAKIRHHQIDLLISNEQTLKYWVNPISNTGAAAEALLIDKNTPWERLPVEGREVRYIDWVIPGILGMNIMFSGLFGVGYVLVRYRKNGVLKRFQATPVTPLQFLGAQILSRLVIMLIATSTVFLVCDLFLDFLMLGNFSHLLLTAFLGNTAVISLGLVIASRSSSEEFANGVLNFIAFPMLLLSGVWYSLDGAPPILTSIAQVFPLTHMVDAARAIMIDGAGFSEIMHHWIVLAGMSATFLGLSAMIFKWR